MGNNRVVVVIVTYGDRWKYLHQVLEAIAYDDHVVEIIVVDNASKNSDELRTYAEEHTKVTPIYNNSNRGSAGGYHQALSKARECTCDYVLMLDDDNVPEPGAVSLFLQTYAFFKTEKVVLVGNRFKLPNTESLFHTLIKDDSPRMTFFTVFSFSKLIHFLSILSPKKKMENGGLFVPIVPTEAFAYGGACIPIEAVRTAPLPDPTLVLYGDDVEYSWNIKKAGYKTYLCHAPRIDDVDTTFGGSHIFGLFESSTRPFTVYYRIRNMVRLSARHSKQSAFALAASVSAWIGALFLLGVVRYGPTPLFFSRSRLIVRAVRDGYDEKSLPPQDAQLP